MGEEVKIKPIIEKYLVQPIADIASGDSPITEDAFAVDGRDLPCVSFRTDSLYNLPKQIPDKVGYFGSIFTSHTLEHCPDIFRLIIEWQQLLKVGGYFIICLPDGDFYDNEENREHFHDTKYKPFVMWVRRAFCGEGYNFKGEQYAPPMFELIEHGQDIGENRYSFYVVLKKMQ